MQVGTFYAPWNASCARSVAPCCSHRTNSGEQTLLEQSLLLTQSFPALPRPRVPVTSDWSFCSSSFPGPVPRKLLPSLVAPQACPVQSSKATLRAIALKRRASCHSHKKGLFHYNEASQIVGTASWHFLEFPSFYLPNNRILRMHDGPTIARTGSPLPSLHRATR